MDRIKKIFETENIILAVVSNKRKSGTKVNKITLKPFENTNGIVYQLSFFDDKQVRHSNHNTAGDAFQEVGDVICDYKSLNIFTETNDYSILIGKKGNISLKKSTPTKKPDVKPHNKVKKYIIEENKPCAFLYELGIMTEEGKVKAQKYNKFVQINRYLEIVSDTVECLPNDKNITVVDFGCGKSYLTFALYYYLVVLKGIDAKVVGVDLKEQVIKDCRNIAAKIGFERMEFICGDIKDYISDDIDMVVSLHACDTATDEALIKAVGWKSKVIISVPCCQHELFPQLKNSTFDPLIKYGVMRDKMATLVTDTLRGLALEINGYDVSVMEFTPLEHTAKNVLIKATYSGKISYGAKQKYDELKTFWNVSPYIDKII